MELQNNGVIKVGDIVMKMKQKGMGRLEYSIVKNVDLDRNELELLQVFPLFYMRSTDFVGANDYMLVGAFGTREWKIIIEMIDTKRADEGLEKLLESKDIKNLLDELELEVSENNLVRANYIPKTPNSILMDLTDVVNYDKFNTVDECLDSINMLREANKLLSEPFFDDKINILYNRLKELTETNL